MSETIIGQLVLDDRVAPGAIIIDGDVITDVDLSATVGEDAPYISPGFVDVHVHGWGGHDAMGDRAALDGMSRALARHGVTRFSAHGRHCADRAFGRVRRSGTRVGTGGAG